MKWFSNVHISADPLERAEQCIEYLHKSGERPEREATASMLLETLKEVTLTLKHYRKIVSLDHFKINHWIAAFGPSVALDALIDFSGLNQYHISGMLRNKNLNPFQVERLKDKTDGSAKGQLNQKILFKQGRN